MKNINKRIHRMHGVKYWKFYLKMHWERLTNSKPFGVDEFVFMKDDERVLDINAFYEPLKTPTTSELQSSKKSLQFYKAAEYVLFHDCCEDNAPFLLIDENLPQWLEILQSGAKISFNNAAQICQNARLPYPLYPNLYATHFVVFQTRDLFFVDAVKLWEEHLKRLNNPLLLTQKEYAQRIYQKIMLEESGHANFTQSYALSIFLAHCFKLMRHIIENPCCSDEPTTLLDLTAHNSGYFYANTAFEEFNGNELTNKKAKELQRDPMLHTCRTDLQKLKNGGTIPYTDAVEFIFEMLPVWSRYETINFSSKLDIEQYLRQQDAQRLNSLLHKTIGSNFHNSPRKI